METFENGAFPHVNTQKRKCRSFSAGSHVVSLDKMAVLKAFQVDPIIVTHAYLVNFGWIQLSLHMPPSLSSRFRRRVDSPKFYFTKSKSLRFRLTALSCKGRLSSILPPLHAFLPTSLLHLPFWNKFFPSSFLHFLHTFLLISFLL